MTALTLVFFASVTIAAVSSGSQSDCPELNQGANNMGNCPRVVCYIPHYAPHRRSIPALSLDDLDIALCTHIIYGFATVENNKLEFHPKYELDVQNVVNLSTNFPTRKVILSVGGGSHKRSKGFEMMVDSAQNRSEFIYSSIKYLRDNGLDGIDLDWEFPNDNTRPGELDNFAALCREMRKALDREAKKSMKDTLVFSIAISKIPVIWTRAYDITSLRQSVDFFNLMSYNMAWKWEKQTRHYAPIFSTKEDANHDLTSFFSINALMNEWVKRGGCKSQLVIGIGFYGNSYQLEDASNYDVKAPANFDRATTHVYSSICQMKNVTSYYDKVQQAAYIVNGDEWIGYENPQSITAKVDYVQVNGLGGVMVWEMSQDDHTGACGQGIFPLMKAIVNQCTTGQAKDSES